VADFNDAVGDTVQEIAVVGDQDAGPLIVLEKLFYPRDAPRVYMVGGLVKKQHIGMGKQLGGEVNPAQFPA
jgi:hypothetical protein